MYTIETIKKEIRRVKLQRLLTFNKTKRIELDNRLNDLIQWSGVMFHIQKYKKYYDENTR